MGRQNSFESSGSFYGDWAIPTIGSTSTTTWQWSDLTANDSAMAWCVSLESGRFWFPAQVNNKDVGTELFPFSRFASPSSSFTQSQRNFVKKILVVTNSSLN